MTEKHVVSDHSVDAAAVNWAGDNAFSSLNELDTSKINILEKLLIGLFWKFWREVGGSGF